jgi:hypothetical protein
MDHLGVEVQTTDEVTAATVRLAAERMATVTDEDAACCYAVQDKVCVTSPGDEPWEVYVVKGRRRHPRQARRLRLLTG